MRSKRKEVILNSSGLYDSQGTRITSTVTAARQSQFGLKLIGQVFLAVPVLALFYPLLSWPIFATRIRLALGDVLDEADAERFGAWFDLNFFMSGMVWTLLFFLSLALGLKLMSSRWLGLFLGAMGGAILASLGRHAWPMMFGDSVTWDTFIIIWLGQEVVTEILFALLLILALAIAAPRDKEPRLRRGFYVGIVLGSFVLTVIFSFTVIVMITAELWEDEELILPVVLLLLVATALMTPGVIVFMVLVYKMWASIQDGHARTRPESALGFLFIPFFNFY